VISAKLPFDDLTDVDAWGEAIDELDSCAAGCSDSVSGSTAGAGLTGVISNTTGSIAISEPVEATTSNPFGPSPRPRKTIKVNAKMTAM
jgi:hypothetical protein